MVRWGLLAFERSGIVVWALAVAGFAIAIAGVVAFRRVRTTVDPFDPEKTTALVTVGVYRLSRNPMYLGMALLLAGWAIHLGSLWSVLGVPAFMLYITRFQILTEERVLHEKFDDAFTAYARRTRRWF